MFDDLKRVGSFVWKLLTEFMGDDCPRMAAALSYYSIFALPPLFGLLGVLTSHFVGPDEVRDFVASQVETFIGVAGARRIVNVVAETVTPDFSGPAAILGMTALVFGATGAFFQMQKALNTAWGVEPDPRRGDVYTFFVKRAVALLMVGAFGLLLLASFVASTFLSFFRRALRHVAPAWTLTWGLPAADVIVSLVAVTLLFTIILRYVPDARVYWRDAIAGGVFTGLLFTGGKVLIAYYLGQSDPANVYGAAGSLAIALLWVYYSAIILLLGAEFTQLWAARHHPRVVPLRGAVRVHRQVVFDDDETDGAVEGSPSAS